MWKLSCIGLLLVPVLNSMMSIYIDRRQIKKLSQNIPETAKNLFGSSGFEKALAYNKEKLRFNTYTNVFSMIQEIIIICYMRQLYEYKFQGLRFSNALFGTSLSLIYQFLEIPFDLFFDFKIEKKYGFNKKTLRVFFYDFFMKIALSVALQLPFFIGIYYIVENFSKFYIYAWIFLAVVQIIIIFIYPTLIAPLFNKFTPLENNSLKDKIDALAKKMGFAIDKINVMDGSMRSAHSNAYFTGLGNVKKIVLYDTLLEQLNEEEILAVLCHELGHCYYYHIYLGLALSLAYTLVYLYIFNIFIYSSAADPTAIKFAKFNIFFSLINLPVKMIINLIKRMWERQADRFAINMGFGNELKSGLIKLHAKNESLPVVDCLYSAVHKDHPHTIERIETIESEMKKKD